MQKKGKMSRNPRDRQSFNRGAGGGRDGTPGAGHYLGSRREVRKDSACPGKTRSLWTAGSVCAWEILDTG